MTHLMSFGVLRLAVKAGMAHSIYRYMCAWQVKLCVSSLTRAIAYLSALKVSHTQYKALYKCPVYVYLLITEWDLGMGVSSHRIFFIYLSKRHILVHSGTLYEVHNAGVSV